MIFAPHIRQRIGFGFVCLLGIIAAHKLYPIFNEEWVIFRHAEQYFHQKQWIKAIPLYETTLKKYPDNFKATLHLADSYVKVKNFPKAIEKYKFYLEVYPNDYEVRLAYAGALEANGNYKEGIEQIRKVLELKSKIIDDD